MRLVQKLNLIWGSIIIIIRHRCNVISSVRARARFSVSVSVSVSVSASVSVSVSASVSVSVRVGARASKYLKPHWKLVIISLYIEQWITNW